MTSKRILCLLCLILVELSLFSTSSALSTLNGRCSSSVDCDQINGLVCTNSVCVCAVGATWSPDALKCYLNQYQLRKITFSVTSDCASDVLLKSQSGLTFQACYEGCIFNAGCGFFTFQSGNCFYYAEVAAVYLRPNPSSNLYRVSKNGVVQDSLYFSTLSLSTPGLINFWPFCSSTTKDIIGKSDITKGVNTSFVVDRFGSPSSASLLSQGYYVIPPGVYFTGGPYTISAWVKVNVFTPFARIVEFGNGPNQDNIIFTCTFTGAIIAKPFISNLVLKVTSSASLVLNKWYQVSTVFNGSHNSIYMNGKLVGVGPTKTPRNVVRNINYIGKTSYTDPIPNISIDEVKIFNRSLNATEISRLFVNISCLTCGIVKWPVNSPCIISDECDSNLLCLGTKCSCPTGLVWTYSLGKCYPSNLAITQLYYTVAGDCNSNILLSSQYSVNESVCVESCLSNPNCYMVTYVSVTCSLYNKFASLYLRSSSTNYLYQVSRNGVAENPAKFASLDLLSPNLVDFWPFCSVNVNDIVNGSNLVVGKNAASTSDRFGNALSASNLTLGYYSAPANIYFSPAFSISVWIRVNQFRPNGRVIDFGSGASLDNVVLAFSYQGVQVNNPYIRILNAASRNGQVVSTRPLLSNKWYHLVATYDGAIATLYINGYSVGKSAQPSPRQVRRTSNFVGRSNNFPTDQDGDFVIDELKIFNKSLTAAEITNITIYDPVSNFGNTSSFGEACSSKLPCESSVGLVCVNSKCVCANGFVWVYQLARCAASIVNQPCSDSSQCGGNGLVCLNSVCSCPANSNFVNGRCSSEVITQFSYSVLTFCTSQILLTSKSLATLNACSSECVSLSNCVFYTYISGTCKTYNRLASLHLTSNSASILYQVSRNGLSIDKKMFDYLLVNDANLVDYWPVCYENGGIQDYKTNKFLTFVTGATWAYDRHTFNGGAINLNNGYYSLPADVYFTGPYTISLWINVNSYVIYTRVLECGNGPNVDTVVLCYANTHDSTPVAYNAPFAKYVQADKPLQIGQWTHFASTFNGTHLALYINGVLSGIDTQPSPKAVVRTQCYLGRSLWDERYANIVVDELKFFKRAFNASEISKITLYPSVNYFGDLLGFNRSCSSSLQCDASIGLKCVNSVCACGPNSNWVSQNNQCSKLVGFNESCSAASQCDPSLNLICSSNSRCSCNANFPWNSVLNKCTNKSVALSVFNYEINNICLLEYKISSNTAASLSACFDLCVANTNCQIFTYESQNCTLYQKQAALIVKSSTSKIYAVSRNGVPIADSYFNMKRMNDPSLVSYWPFCYTGSDILDYQTNKPIIWGAGAVWGTSRFGLYGGALNLNNGYYTIPSGVYFTGPYTISLWINVNSYVIYTRVLECGNGPNVDTVVLCYANTHDSTPVAYNAPHAKYVQADKPLQIGQWTHFASTFNGTHLALYINGVLSGIDTQPSPKAVVRTQCYLGRSLWDNLYANIVVDELKFFNRALSASELKLITIY